jgi:2-methylcitrate dehydratase PrpD
VPDEIEKVAVKTHRFASDLDEKAPKTPTAAKSSISFCVALAIHRGCVALDEFTADNIGDATIAELARKVEVQLDPELDRIHLAHEDLRPSMVEIHLRNGRVLSERRDVAKGWAINPLSEEEFEGKFQGLAQTSLSRKRATGIFELGRGIENLPDVALFIEELAHF